MNLLNDIPHATLHFYLTAPYPCSYLPDMQARSQVATPMFLINGEAYSDLVQQGFRRSGNHTYRPRCDSCKACVPLRVMAKQFEASRSQRRAWNRHAELETSLHPLQDSAEHYDLYQRYQSARHKNGGMDNEDREAYQNFLLQSHVDSVLVEFREHGVLRMVSVIDLLNDGLSSIYTFFEPDLPNTSFGIYNVLWQVELCRKLDLDFVYLGYWIAQSRKMAYKIKYFPAQGLVDGTWQDIDLQVKNPNKQTQLVGDN